MVSTFGMNSGRDGTSSGRRCPLQKARRSDWVNDGQQFCRRAGRSLSIWQWQEQEVRFERARPKQTMTHSMTQFDIALVKVNAALKANNALHFGDINAFVLNINSAMTTLIRKALLMLKFFIKFIVIRNLSIPDCKLNSYTCSGHSICKL